MPTVFLSYSSKDHHFAELITTKLAEYKITVWRDIKNIRAGNDWRKDIENGIRESSVIIVALSSNSVDSSYVTFEWAYGLGYGKNIIPLKLNECEIHPRLQTIQYLDFSIQGALPWESLIDRINEIEIIAEEDNLKQLVIQNIEDININTRSIIAYMDQQGYQAISFDAIRKRIDNSLTDEKINQLILDYPTLIRHAKLKSGRPGLKKIQP